MHNRRAHRRTRIDRRVEIVPVKSGGHPLPGSRKGASAPAPAVGRMVDLGCGGLAAELAVELEVGTPVEIRITGDDGRIQSAHGTVRNVRSVEGTLILGIAFSEPLLVLGDPERRPSELPLQGSEPLALVIDDDYGVRTVLERFLAGRGLRVVCVPSAEEGLEIMRGGAPALVLLDLKMEGMGGVAMLETMRAEGLRCPHVWAMSGLVDDDEARRALSFGASEFLNKPFDLDHLDYCLRLVAPIL